MATALTELAALAEGTVIEKPPRVGVGILSSAGTGAISVVPPIVIVKPPGLDMFVKQRPPSAAFNYCSLAVVAYQPAILLAQPLRCRAVGSNFG